MVAVKLARRELAWGVVEVEAGVGAGWSSGGLTAPEGSGGWVVKLMDGEREGAVTAAAHGVWSGSKGGAAAGPDGCGLQPLRVRVVTFSGGRQGDRKVVRICAVAQGGAGDAHAKEVVVVVQDSSWKALGRETCCAFTK